MNDMLDISIVMSESETDDASGASPAEPEESGDDEYELVDSVRFGSILYGVVGIGTFITFLLMAAIGDDDATFPFSFYEDEALYTAAEGSYLLVLYLVAFVAVAIGYLYYSNDDIGDNAPKFSAVGAAVGSAIILLVLMLLMIIFEPEFFEVDFGDEIPVILAAVIGSAITATATTFLLTNYNE